MSGIAATLQNASRVIEVYSDDARTKGGARLMAYSDLVVLMGLHSAQARNLGPLLDRVREVCVSRGLPDVSSVIVLKGTSLPSPKSFDGVNGTWRRTGLTPDAVRREQRRVLDFDWSVVA